MRIRRCKSCNKELSPDYIGQHCTLCKMGLIPVSKPQYHETSREHTIVVDSRALTGMHCPCCYAEFTINDFENNTCSICRVEFSVQEMSAIRLKADAKRMMAERKQSQLEV